MEDKRKDGGSKQAAGDSAGTPSKRPEAPVAEPPSSRRRGGSHKRKASGNGATPPTAPSSKRQAREKNTSAAAAPIHNGPLTRARQSPAADEVVKIEAPAAPAAEGGSGRQRAAAVVEEDWEAKVEAEYEAIVSRGVNAHAVPIPAGKLETKMHFLALVFVQLSEFSF